MDVKVNCPRCGDAFSVDEKQAGAAVECPTYKYQVNVPAAPIVIPPQSQGVKRSKSGTKTFTSVFLAILAAVGVIVLIIFLAAPFVRYSNAKRVCLAEMHSALQDANDATGSPEMRLAQMEAAMKRDGKARETLIFVIEHKPWSLPLSHGESVLLSELKSEIRRETASALKNTLEMYKAVYGDYPQGTPQEQLKALDGENPRNIHFNFGRAHLNLNSAGEPVDPWGKPYPFDVTQLEAIGP